VHLYEQNLYTPKWEFMPVYIYYGERLLSSRRARRPGGDLEIASGKGSLVQLRGDASAAAAESIA
jgi:hypothetical protein